MILVSVSRNSLILAFFALITAAVLALTFDKTKGRIADSERRAAEKALLDIIPRQRHTNNMLEDTLAIASEDLALLGFDKDTGIHLAKNGSEVSAVIVPTVAKDGYSGAIKMIVGVNATGDIAGVRILTHKETPGLGDKIDLNKGDWILSFDGKSLTNPTPENWAVKKDGGEFDQFTGATITPRAVVNQIAIVLAYVQQNRAIFFEETAP